MPTPKMKTPATAPADIDADFYVVPVASRFWSSLNHSGTRLFVNALRRLSGNATVTVNIATSAMSVGIRAIVRIPFVHRRLPYANIF
jgi:hypothetical protein